MDDRVPIEAREEPSEASDLLENRRDAIRKEAGDAILLGAASLLAIAGISFFSILKILHT